MLIDFHFLRYCNKVQVPKPIHSETESHYFARIGYATSCQTVRTLKGNFHTKNVSVAFQSGLLFYNFK
ncbi:hypothetical protein T07_12785 [Trichinella nelsoni]|uniref:Uncharacterized protein n=1 Tax=Trichinella nelsoni TaxID=6336 RepID=A0A0V0RT19_9BILA|nr:hypothetical protein T07_12785 [Trichinella nelsoni]